MTNRRANFLDRAIMALAPGWGLSRVRARAVADLVVRHYESASIGRRTANWSRRSTDANAAAGALSLSRLRDQARDMVRNDPYAKRGLRRLAVSTVGWGIRPKATGPAAVRAAALWKKWGETTACDADGRLTFYGLQRQVMTTIPEAGEVLIRRRWRRPADGVPIPMQLQVLEPDHLDATRDMMRGQQGGPIIQGVELDAIGRRVAYWLYPTHPGAAQFTTPVSVRVDASEILHVFYQERPGQLRGPSWFAPVDVRLHDLHEFEDAALMKQKVAALFAAFVTDVDGAAPAFGEEDKTTNPPTDTMEPGLISNLPPGKSVSFSNPPLTTDPGFMTGALHAIAAGIGTTYEDLTGDYCVAPETRILRADLRWVRADSLIEGDEIVAFDDEPPGGQGHRRKWRKASVVRSAARELARRRIVTDRATVTVSDEHLFLCTLRGPSGAARGEGLQARSEDPSVPGYGQRWVRADQLRPGDQIVFLCAPWEVGRSYAHGYLKGMADGEGYLDAYDAKIGIAQNPGPVFDELGTVLSELGFTARQRDANGGHKCQQWALTGIAECLRFLGEVRPTRLLRYADSVYDGRMLSGGAKKSGAPTAAVVQSVENIGVGAVVTLETSTRTLVTEGLCSHNSQVNYSSARMSRLAMYGDVNDWRWNMLVPQFCQPAWAWMVEAAQLAGLMAEAGAEWTAPPTPMVDPEKEGLALARMVRTGAKTHDEMVREQGYDPDDFWAEYAAGLKKLDQLGIVLDSDPRRTTGQGQAQQADPGKAAKPAPQANGNGKVPADQAGEGAAAGEGS